MTSGPSPISPDDLDLFKKYRELLMPAARMSAYDEFAKWIFTITAIIGTFGAAFSNSAMNGLTGTGARLFFSAIAATSLSLALSVIQRAINVGKVNWASLDDMLKRAESAMRLKRAFAWAGGVSFALALFLAGLAPMFSTVSPKPVVARPGFQYSLDKDGIHVLFTTTKLDAIAEMKIVAVLPKSETVLAIQRTTSDSAGELKMDLRSPAPPKECTAVKISLNCDVGSKRHQDFVIALQPAIAPDDRQDSGSGMFDGCIK